MIPLEREAQVVRLGEEDARNRAAPRAGEFPTVSEQLAYMRGYGKPNGAKKLRAALFVACVATLLAWAVWAFSVQLEVLKYGSMTAFSTGWDAFGYCGLWVTVLTTFLWCLRHRT